MADIIENKNFSTKNDWLDQLMLATCSAMKTVKRMVEGKEVEHQERDGVDVDALRALARENGFEPKVHNKANPGLHRMTVGNALRARARKRHGLLVAGKFLAASEDFVAGKDKTENPDGSKYESPTVKAAREQAAKDKAAAVTKKAAEMKEATDIKEAAGHQGQGRQAGCQGRQEGRLTKDSWSRPQRPP